MIRNKQFITKSEDGVIKTLIHPLKVNVLVRTLALEWRLNSRCRYINRYRTFYKDESTTTTKNTHIYEKQIVGISDFKQPFPCIGGVRGVICVVCAKHVF